MRVDKDRSLPALGRLHDPESRGDARQLSNYSRSLTGARGHYENERVSANVFATQDTTRQVIEELRANGTSGPVPALHRAARS